MNQFVTNGTSQLENFSPLNVTCGHVMNYAPTVLEFCGHTSEDGLGPLTRLIPEKVQELVLKGCGVALKHSSDVIKVCSDIHEVGLGVLDTLGNHSITEMTMKACLINEESRHVILISTGVCALVGSYFAYRLVNPNRNSPCDKEHMELVPVLIEPEYVQVKLEPEWLKNIGKI